ncbi:MAG: hypothetical protein [Arizlama microvirus]|nr:MAG: hypothetical protein [Arizlama microvirus]
MSKRYKMSKKSSRNDFRRNASYTHKKNIQGTSGPMRGGIRL